MVTFVLATYAMVAFVHISNISAVSGPILTKLFGHNFLGVTIFAAQNILGPKFFRNKLFWTQKFLGPKVFRPKFFFSDAKHLLNRKKFQIFFSDENFFFYPNFFSYSFGSKIFFEPQLLWTRKILDQIFFVEAKFLRIQYLFWTWRLPL